MITPTIEVTRAPSEPDNGAPAVSAPQKVLIKSFGCQMNVYDSERMAESLAAQGYVTTDDQADADLVILNTCHIREKAAEKVYSDLGRLRDLKSERALAGKSTLIAVAGCVAQAEGAEIISRAPAVDIVVGPQSTHRLPQLIARARRGEPAIDTEFPAATKFDQLPGRRAAAGPSAFLTVQEGCDKFCTFCVVPYTRGSEYSRPPHDVLAEARRLADGGVRELTLLGQNVNAYHGESADGAVWSLARLIEALAGIAGLDRLRYTTSHPHDMGGDLVDAHRSIDKLMPFLHLPVQSGSDRMLAAMNRKHTADDYRRLVDRVRTARPDIGLSTDIIVGFPGETDADFAATLQLIREVVFAQAYSFKYSARPGTPAAGLTSQVPDAVRRQRLAELQALVDQQQRNFNTASIGRTMPVLFEKTGRHPGQLTGRSPYLQPVHVEADESLIGQIRDVVLTSHSSRSLGGRVVRAS